MSIIHQMATTSRSRSLGWRIAGTAILAAAMASGTVAPAHAGLFGPTGPTLANGFPESYSDGRLVLGQCIGGEQCLAQGPNPAEQFWFLASAETPQQIGLYTAALEGAYLNDPAVAGEETGFGRLRFQLSGLVTGASYRIQHPYGEITLVDNGPLDKRNTLNGVIEHTADVGCVELGCNFDTLRPAFLGNFTGMAATPFLTQANPAPGMIGDMLIPGPVGGAPSGINAVIVTGPNAGGPGVNILKVTNFAVQGKLMSAPVAPSAPVKAPTVTAGKLSALVSWPTPANGGSNITGYSVRITNATTGALITTRSAAGTSLNVTGLPVGVSLRASVQAKNAVGTGGLSVASGAVRPQSTPGAPIIRPAAYGAVGGAITATANWLPPLSNNGNAINGYVVTALRMNPGGPVLRRTNSVVQHFSKRTLSMTLPAGSYRFVVRARNGWGLGVATSAMSSMVVAR